MNKFRSTFLIIAIAGISVGCSGRIGTSLAQQCSEQLSAAESELGKAKADGLGDAVEITKAASLVGAAEVQKQFERYEGCVSKARRARGYIADARKH